MEVIAVMLLICGVAWLLYAAIGSAIDAWRDR